MNMSYNVLSSTFVSSSSPCEGKRERKVCSIENFPTILSVTIFALYCEMESTAVKEKS
jgi:hypothetical protein